MVKIISKLNLGIAQKYQKYRFKPKKRGLLVKICFEQREKNVIFLSIQTYLTPSNFVRIKNQIALSIRQNLKWMLLL